MQKNQEGVRPAVMLVAAIIFGAVIFFLASHMTRQKEKTLPVQTNEVVQTKTLAQAEISNPEPASDVQETVEKSATTERAEVSFSFDSPTVE
jgi:hypothetical protein